MEFTHAFYHIGAKIIQLKIYYEAEETEAFFSLIQASRQYLSRNRHLSDYQIQSNANFLRLTQKLFQLRAQEGLISPTLFQQKLTALRQLVEQTEPVANKDWVEVKCEALCSVPS